MCRKCFFVIIIKIQDKSTTFILIIRTFVEIFYLFYYGTINNLDRFLTCCRCMAFSPTTQHTKTVENDVFTVKNRHFLFLL